MNDDSLYVFSMTQTFTDGSTKMTRRICSFVDWGYNDYSGYIPTQDAESNGSGASGGAGASGTSGNGDYASGVKPWVKLANLTAGNTDQCSAYVDILQTLQSNTSYWYSNSTGDLKIDETGGIYYYPDGEREYDNNDLGQGVTVNNIFASFLSQYRDVFINDIGLFLQD